MGKKVNIYREHGFDDRKDYLNNLADEHSLPEDVVYTAASVLGESEDFDGLINMLEDLEQGGF